MIMLIFQHSAKQLAFRGRTVEPPQKPHEATEKVLLERQREYGNEIVPILTFFSYKPWFSVPGRRFPRARLQSTPTNRKF